MPKQQVVKVGFSFDGSLAKTSEQFCEIILSGFKDIILKTGEMHPIFVGKSQIKGDDFIGLAFSNGIITSEDMVEAIGICNHFSQEYKLNQTLLVIPSVSEDSQEVLKVIVFGTPTGLLYKTVDIYRTKGNDIFGFGDSELENHTTLEIIGLTIGGEGVAKD